MTFKKKRFTQHETEPSLKKGRYSSLESNYSDKFKNDFSSRFQMIEHQGMYP